jgi:hypothetical protein
MPAINARSLGVLGLALLGLAAAGEAGAWELPREFHQNASGTCQAALPAYEGQIRKRPLALQNEGEANAFVSCSLFSPGASTSSFLTGEIYAVMITLDNNGSQPVDVACTLIAGASRSSANHYFTKTITLPANSTYNQIAWSQDPDFDGGKIGPPPGISCNLRPGVGIATTSLYYHEEVGQ